MYLDRLLLQISLEIFIRFIIDLKHISVCKKFRATLGNFVFNKENTDTKTLDTLKIPLVWLIIVF